MKQVARDARVDAYVEGAPEFARPLLRHLRMLVHRACGDVEETMKWSRPFFLYRGELVANMAAFKAHCSFGFWGPAMGEVLREAALEGDEASGSLERLTGMADLPSDAALSGWLTSAFRLAGERAAGKRNGAVKGGPARQKPQAAKEDLAVPPDLTGALARVEGAAERFAALSRSCRKEYVGWIEEAKRAETRAKRLAEAVAMIAEGKRRNWKYETNQSAGGGAQGQPLR